VELSPPAVRGLFPGLAYQLGVLLAANAAYVESLMAVRMGYANALAVVALTVLVAGTIVIASGHERAGIDLHA
jgi:SHS family lactate transporter-like MFS transporter